MNKVMRPISMLILHKVEEYTTPCKIFQNISVTAGFLMDICTWESCRTMPLVDGFSQRSPVSPPLHSSAAPFPPLFSHIGSEDLVKRRPNLSTFSTPRSNATAAAASSSGSSDNYTSPGPIAAPVATASTNSIESNTTTHDDATSAPTTAAPTTCYVMGRYSSL
ncbi:hypothetical protein PR048_002871 [Dryococelus australis]|uniref:Uncharacterized protein n=1 Tax=Dryococelus australis TaxID=614101 RepID=A0ABQ9ILK8_9NEOP|nr:hypothetical protein PR048_002871 [Dryococelus australis]